MKTTSLLLAPVLGLAIFLSPARADEPAPAAVSPDVQALLGELSKLAAGSKAKDEPVLDVPALFGTVLKLVMGATAKDGQAVDVQALLGQVLKAVPEAAAKDGQAKDAQGQELQVQLTELLKVIAKMVPEDAPAPDPAAANPAGAATTEAKPAPAPAAGPKTSLATGSLTTGGLAPSSSVNGRGQAGGTPRLNENEWRQLFPAREDRK